jgi:hypothetical protein
LPAVRRGWWTGFGAAACTLAAAAPAGAAFDRAPIQLGAADGERPGAVVDPAGTAHIVWGIAEELIGYCALPRGARQCSRTTQLALDGRASRPFIMRRPQDGALIVVAARESVSDDPGESVWAFASADGVTWSGPAQIGIGAGESLDAAVLTADGQAVDLLDNTMFQRAPLASPPATALLNLASTPAGTEVGYDQSGEMVRLRDGRTLAFLAGSTEGTAYRILSGTDPFADASWQPWPARPVTRDWDAPRATAGRRGAYVMYRQHIVDQIRGAPPQVVRKLRKRGWGRPRGLFYEVQANTENAALAEDGKGNLHAIVVGYASGGDLRCITYARTYKRRWFTRAVTLHQTLKEADEPDDPHLAVDDRGRGIVAWTTGATPSVARAQWVKAGRGVTRPRGSGLDRGCPPFPR